MILKRQGDDMKKRIMILIVLLGIVLYEAFMLWPRPLGSNLDKDSLYVIVSEAKNTKNEESFSESFINNRTWRIEKQSATSQQMIDILDDYYYHYNFESFFSKSSLDSKKIPKTYIWRFTVIKVISS